MKLAKTLIAVAIGLGAAHAAFAANVPGPLVTPQWLKAHLNEVTVIDIRGGGSMKAYDEEPVMGKNHFVKKSGGHIAGADLVNFNDIREERTVDGVKLKAMMPTAEYFTQVMDKAGVNSGTPSCAPAMLWVLTKTVFGAAAAMAAWTCGRKAQS